MKEEINRIKSQINDLYKQIERLEEAEAYPEWEVTAKSIREIMQREFPHFSERYEEKMYEPYYINFVNRNDHLEESIVAYRDGYEYVMGYLSDPINDQVYSNYELKSIDELKKVIYKPIIPVCMYFPKRTHFITGDIGLEYCKYEPELFNVTKKNMSSKEVMGRNEKVWI